MAIDYKRLRSLTARRLFRALKRDGFMNIGEKEQVISCPS